MLGLGLGKLWWINGDVEDLDKRRSLGLEERATLRFI